MKKIPIIFLLFLTFTCLGQSKFKVNLSSGMNYTFSKYTYNEGFTFDEDIDFKMPIGYFINAEVEFSLSERNSVLTGLRFSKHNIHPRLALPWAYGTRFELGDETIWMNTPYLAKHEIKTLSVPITFKRYFRQEKRFSYFVLVGVEAEFQFDETETYLDLFEGFGTEDDAPPIAAYRDQDVQLFNTSIEVGFGFTYKLKESINLLVQSSVNVLDVRKGNEKFKKNGDMIWEDTFLPVGNVSLGFGLQKEF